MLITERILTKKQKDFSPSQLPYPPPLTRRLIQPSRLIRLSFLSLNPNPSLGSFGSAGLRHAFRTALLTVFKHKLTAVLRLL
jgi:hypothetical protein